MTEIKQPMQVGLIGLGAMGMGMAKSLLKAGFPVRGYDINAAAVENFVAVKGRRRLPPRPRVQNCLSSLS